MTQTAGATSKEAKNSSAIPKASEPGADAPSRQTSEPGPQSSSRDSTAELGGMILALVFGGLGFAFRILWIPAMVVMAVVFGLMLADHRASRGSKHVMPEIVANVMNEARDIYQAASGTSGKDDSESEVKEDTDDADDSTRTKDATPAEEGPSVSRDEAPLQAQGRGSGDGAVTNGHSSIQDDGSTLRDAILEPKPADTRLVETESVQEASEEKRSTEPEGTESERIDSGDSHALANGSSDTSATHFPLSLIISADRMAAHSPLLRPVRKRLLGVAASLSRAIAQMASTPSDE